MNMTKIGWKNKGGTGKRRCRCISWGKHWLNYNNYEPSWPTRCSVLGCRKPPTLGAHVINPKHEDKGEQIIPMCASCNKSEEAFNLRNNVRFAIANVAKTCGK